MRIGVHSGSVLGGILGLQKWQFDIWSWDVDIASSLEAAGVPGWDCKTLRCLIVETTVLISKLQLSRRVHISRSTLDCLGGTYEAEAGHGQDRSEFLRKHNIDTYLIRPAAQKEAERPKARRPSHDEMTTWSAELPFGDILGMNFVRSLTSRSIIFLLSLTVAMLHRSSPPSPTAR